MIRDTSISAYAAHHYSGSLSAQQSKIMNCLYDNPQGLTRRQIREITGIESGSVCGRTKELETLGQVVERIQVTCKTTGRPVWLVEIAV